MRKIELGMLAAIFSKADKWVDTNTGVYLEEAGNPYGSRSEIYLYGNHIADYWHGDGVLPLDSPNLDVDMYTLARWPSMTTKSRLRALGADVSTIKGVTYLNGKPV